MPKFGFQQPITRQFFIFKDLKTVMLKLLFFRYPNWVFPFKNQISTQKGEGVGVGSHWHTWSEKKIDYKFLGFRSCTLESQRLATKTRHLVK
jgi:hypothetical protein